MQLELIGPTATLAAAILSKISPQHDALTQEVIASAFEEAHRALQAGIRRVDAAQDEKRRKDAQSHLDSQTRSLDQSAQGGGASDS